MINLCSKCNKPLDEGEKVTFLAIGTYRKLPSVRSWAVNKETLEADIRSIRHLNCQLDNGD